MNWPFSVSVLSRSQVLSHVRLIGNLLDLSAQLPVVTRAEKLHVPVSRA